MNIDLQWIKDNEISEQSRINNSQYDASAHNFMMIKLDKSSNALSRQDIRKIEEELLATIQQASNNNAISIVNDRLLSFIDEDGNFLKLYTEKLDTLYRPKHNNILCLSHVVNILENVIY